MTPFEELGYEVIKYGQKSYNGVAIISKLKIENVQKGFTYENKEKNISVEFNEQKRLISADINGLKIINFADFDKYKFNLNFILINFKTS